MARRNGDRLAEEKKEPRETPEYNVYDQASGSDDDSREGNDPYVYSDDSASLSDAYFFPQASDDDLARPPRYREQDPLHPHQHVYYYGSLLGQPVQEQRASSPLWVSSPTIQEDSDLLVSPDMARTPLMMLDESMLPSAARKERRRQRREAQRLRMKQREQVARERAVAQVRGKPQEVAQHDTLWAVLFLIQLALVVVCAITFGLGLIQFNKSEMNLEGSFHWQHRRLTSLRHNETLGEVVYTDDDKITQSASVSGHATQDDSLFTFDYQNVVSLVGITGFYACILTYISFGFMLILARALIQVVLVFSVLLALGWGLIGLSLDPYGVISIMGFSALLVTLGYTMYNWNRIPFAATNLYTALCAMRCTADITILGLCSLVVAFWWCVIWSMAFVGVVNAFNSIDCDQKDACDPHVTWRHAPIYLLLLLSFYWTNSVIKNVVRATVAAAIGTWWFHPQAIRPFCTSAVLGPLGRNLTSSLGSICLGSLVINFAQLASAFGSGCCCLFGNSDCMYNQRVAPDKDAEAPVVEEDSAADSVGLGRRICGLSERINKVLRSCNRWSFTYIGMYGYGFLDAGERAIQLFETREWLDVVRDNLIQNVLVMASMVIGGSAGTFAVVVEETDGYYFSSFHMPTFSAFVIGSVLGYVLSNILLLGVVGSAVNTVLVCFAAGPFEFDRNHARLSREMREVWSQQVWEPQV